MGKRKLLMLMLVSVALVVFTSCRKYDATDSPADIKIDNKTGYEDASDYVWDNSEVIEIGLNGTTVTENSDGVLSVGGKVTITSAGTYRLSGTLTNGQIIVSTADEKIVRLILNGVNITCTSSAPVYVKNATKVMIDLAENTENYITDGTSYIVDADNEPNAAIFSKSYLSFFGTGSLTVDGNFADGIASKDGLVIKSGIINVSSPDDGIRGKDYLIVRDGNITINAGGDGLKSDNDADADCGFISIDTGVFNIVASDDGLDAQTNITIEKGTFTINSAEDAVHSDNSVVINGGTISIASGDDAIHAETSVAISNEILNITKCYEGIESASITVNSGTLSLASTDDGFNATKGKATEANDGSCIYINGGNIVVNSSSGDGLDSNGNIAMTAGTVIVHGPQSAPEVAFDVNGTFNISGGILIGTGPNSGNMIEATSTASAQYTLKATSSSTLSASTMLHIQDANAGDILTFKPVRNIYYVVFSSSVLINGSTYSIYTGGTSTGTNTNGLYSGGTYTGGILKKNFTVSGKLTNISF